MIANNAQKQQKLFVQGYNLEVHDVIKYTRKHRAINDVTGAYVIIMLVYRCLLTKVYMAKQLCDSHRRS